MSVTAVTRPLTPAQILARLRQVDGVGSQLDADIVLAPIARAGGSFGGFPSPTSGMPLPFTDPATVVQRFLLGN